MDVVDVSIVSGSCQGRGILFSWGLWALSFVLAPTPFDGKVGEIPEKVLTRDVKFEPTGNAPGRAPGPRRAFAGPNVRRAGLVRDSA